MTDTMKVADIKVGDNVRIGELRLPDSFVHSIATLGILQPLVVDDKGQLIAGHRRLAGAIEAGLDEVPVHIRATNGANRIVLQVVENIQRENLSQWELAQATFDLKSDGMKYDDIAESLGIDRAEIPALVKAAKVDIADEHASQLTIEAIGAIGDAASEIEGIEVSDIARAIFDHDARDVRQAVRYAQDEVKAGLAYEELATLQNEWHEAGVVVVTDDPRHTGKTDKWDRPVRDANVILLEGYDGLGIPVSDHISEPCHVVWVHEIGFSVKAPAWDHYCVDKRRHMAKGTSELKVPETSRAGGMSDKEKEDRRKAREEKAKRYRQSGQFLLSSGNKDERYRLALRFAVEHWRSETTRSVVLALIEAGEIDKRPKGADPNWYDTQLDAWLESSFDDDTKRLEWKMRALLAHEYIEQRWGFDRVWSDLAGDLSAIEIEEDE